MKKIIDWDYFRKLPREYVEAPEGVSRENEIVSQTMQYEPEGEPPNPARLHTKGRIIEKLKLAEKMTEEDTLGKSYYYPIAILELEKKSRPTDGIVNVNLVLTWNPKETGN